VRYFGGILLGTGGLVHAYSEAAIGALNNAEVITYNTYSTISINLSYSDHGKCMMAFSEYDFLVSDTEYAEAVTVLGTVLADNEKTFLDKLTEITSGRCKFEVISQEYAYR
jgi:putative IMPACT (imprinted ancient) family translation regulator